MSWKADLWRNGYLKTVDENGVQHSVSLPRTDTQEIMNMCLSCTKKKCNGNCIDIRRKKNETKSRDN